MVSRAFIIGLLNGLALSIIAAWNGLHVLFHVPQHPLNMFELYTLNGRPYDVGQLWGGTVVLNVWATECKPCLEELPIFNMVAKTSKNVQFVLISDEEVAKDQNFVNQCKYSLLFCSQGGLSKTLKLRFIQPLIYDPSGKIHSTIAGPWPSIHELEAIIQKQ